MVLAVPTRCGPYAKEDQGCVRDGNRISRRCIDCHIEPDCLESLPGGITTLRRDRRQQLVRGFRQKGASIRTIANAFRMSNKTVYRMLQPPQEVRRKRWRATKRRQREGA